MNGYEMLRLQASQRRIAINRGHDMTTWNAKPVTHPTQGFGAYCRTCGMAMWWENERIVGPAAEDAEPCGHYVA